MPSSSPKQARLMAAIAHGWRPPPGSGINVPIDVAKEFNAADQAQGLLRRKKRNLASVLK